MIRDDARAKCIEEMAKAYYEAKRHINVKSYIPSWEELGPTSRLYRLQRMTAAFDALNGIARVNPIEATEEMHVLSGEIIDGPMISFTEYWRKMSAVADLTNPPEKKP